MRVHHRDLGELLPRVLGASSLLAISEALLGVSELTVSQFLKAIS